MKRGQGPKDYTLGLQVPSEKVFGVGLEGPNTFSGGTWRCRAMKLLMGESKAASIERIKQHLRTVDQTNLGRFRGH